MNPFFLTPILLGLCGSIAYAQWQLQAIDTQSDFRGLCVVSPKVVWVSRTKGTYARTTDGGKGWSVGVVPSAEQLDFRDVEAFGETTAYLLSAGPGDASRIYKTVNGGKMWTMQFKGTDPATFLDAIAFWDEMNGMALGDPIKGQFQLLVTTDGGANWKPLQTKTLPPALPGEGAFAASGTCLVTHGKNDVWFVTGGAKSARVFRSNDRGQNWAVSETPIMAGTESVGILSIAFRDPQNGIIVGGDFRKPDATGATVAITSDGGKTWAPLDKKLPFRSAVAWAKDRWVAVGTSGSHVSLDNGNSWKLLDRENYNSVGFAPTGEGWAVGPKGRIAKFVPEGLEKARADLKSPQVEIRRAAIRSLVHSDLSAPLREEIQQALKDEDAEVRATAATATGNLGAAAVPAVLLLIDRMRNDSSKEARETAARALGRIGKAAKEERRPVAPLRQTAVKDSDPVTRVVALGALAMMEVDIPEQVAALRKYLHDDASLVRMKAAHALGMIGAPAKAAAAEIVTVLERSKDPHERGYIARAVGNVGDPASLPALVKAFQAETDLGARGEMQGAITRLGGKVPEKK